VIAAGIQTGGITGDPAGSVARISAQATASLTTRADGEGADGDAAAVDDAAADGAETEDCGVAALGVGEVCAAGVPVHAMSMSTDATASALTPSWCRAWPTRIIRVSRQEL
jgi:hypothetical protein